MEKWFHIDDELITNRTRWNDRKNKKRKKKRGMFLPLADTGAADPAKRMIPATRHQPTGHLQVEPAGWNPARSSSIHLRALDGFNTGALLHLLLHLLLPLLPPLPLTDHSTIVAYTPGSTTATTATKKNTVADSSRSQHFELRWNVWIWINFNV